MFKGEVLKLSQNVKVYVPSTEHASEPAAAEKITAETDNVIKLLSGWFGGATSYAGKGGWYSFEQKAVIQENVTIVSSFCDKEAMAAHEDDVYQLALHIKDAFSQEAVSVEVDGSLYLI